VDLTEAVELARTNHHSILATRRADGSPQMSPVVHGVDGSGRVMISTREPAMKVRNLRRERRAWLCVLPDGFFGAWAQLGGPCEIIALPEAMSLLEDIYRQVAGEHPDWVEFRQAMEHQRRVVLRLTPDQAGPTASG